MDAQMITVILQVLGTIIVAGLTTLIGLYAARKQDRRIEQKQETDRAAQLNDMALELIEPYKNEVALLRTKLHDLECELLKERDKRRELEELVMLKDGRIAEMQIEIDGLRSEVDALQKGRKR